MAPLSGRAQAPDAPPPPTGASEAPEAPAPRAESAPRDADAPSPRSAAEARDDERSGARLAVTPRGSTGVLRTSAAQSLTPGLFRLSLGLDFFSADGTIRDGDGASRVRGILAISGSPIDYLELWLNIGFASTNSNLTEPNLLQSLGDLGFGAKGFYPLFDFWGIGAEVDLRLLTDVGSSGIGAAQVRGGLLNTFDFTTLDRPVPLRIHQNSRVIYDGSDELGEGGASFTTAEQLALGIAEFHRLEANVAIEVPVKFVTPYLEYGIEIPLDYLATPGVVVEASGQAPKQAVISDGPARPALARVVPQRLTPGLRVTALRDFAFDVAVEIGLTQDTARGVPVVPPYNVVFLASYNLDPFDVRGERGRGGPPVSVPVIVPSGPAAGGARLVGTVVDRDSGAPIPGAIVRFDRSTPVATEESGRFESQYIDGGPLRVTVAADGYEPGSADLDLPDDDVAEVQVALAPAGAMVRGTVEDARGPRAGASVQVFGAAEQTIQTDESGAFALQLPVGPHRLVVKPDDALATGAVVDATAGETTVVALRLLPAPDEPVEPVDGRIPLPEPILFEPESATPPREAARSLAPVVDLLLRRPDLQVRVAGHTDNQGDAAALQRLSEERAKAIRDLLVRKGVPSAQLGVQGYGADRPIAPNVTRRGRAQNNRVEIEVAD